MIAKSNKFGEGLRPAPNFWVSDLVIHTAHATSRHGGSLFLLGHVCDQDIGRQDHRRNGCSVLQRAAHNLDGVNDTRFDHVGIFAGEDVETNVRVLLLSSRAADGIDNHGAVFASVGGQLADGGFQRLLDDVDADLDFLVFIFSVGLGELVKFGGGIDEGDLTAGDDAFFHCRAGCGEGVFHAVLLFLHFSFGRGAHTDDGNTTAELGETFLKFFLVVIAGALVDLGADLLDAAFDFALLALAADDGGVLLVSDNLLGAAEVLEGGGFEFAAGLFRDDLSTGEGGDILRAWPCGGRQSQGP